MSLCTTDWRRVLAAASRSAARGARALTTVVWVLGCGAQAEEGTSGGNTSWLGACSSDDACATGLCTEGACAERCANDRECGGLGAARCVATSCGAASTSICAPVCERDSDCASIGGDYACAGGTCVPACDLSHRETPAALGAEDEVVNERDARDAGAPAPSGVAPGARSRADAGSPPSEVAPPEIEAAAPAEPASRADAGLSSPPLDPGSSQPTDAPATPLEPVIGLDGTLAWGSPTLAENIGEYVSSPRVVTDGAGDALAVWRQWDDSVPQRAAVSASRYEAGGWSEATAVFQLTGGYLNDPCLAGNASGAAVASWSTSSSADTSSVYEAWASVFSPEGGWSDPVQLGPTDGPMSTTECAMDDLGNAHVVWAQSAQAGTLLYDARYFNGAWAPYESVAGASTHVGSISLALNGVGDALVLWNDWESEQPTLWSNRYSPAEGWQGPAPLATPDAWSSYYLDVALNDAGEAVAAWSLHSSDGLQHQIWAASLTTSGEWSPAEQLDDSQQIASAPVVGLDAAGNAIALWEGFTQLTESTYKNDVAMNRFTPQGGWDGPAVLKPNATQISFAMRPNSVAIASWRAPYEYTVDGDIGAAWYAPDTGWSEVTLFADDDPANSTTPSASVNDSGVATFVWLNQDNSGSNIWSNRRE